MFAEAHNNFASEGCAGLGSLTLLDAPFYLQDVYSYLMDRPSGVHAHGPQISNVLLLHLQEGWVLFLYALDEWPYGMGQTVYFSQHNIRLVISNVHGY